MNFLTDNFATETARLGPEVWTVIRFSYGLLLLGTVLYTLPHWRRFYLSERWGGYAQSTRVTDAIQNPTVVPWLMTLWITCAALIAVGKWTLAATAINLLLCRYFFVQMRWQSLTRGQGAPGFMTWWMGVAVFLIECAQRGPASLQALVLLTLQLDFALIMLSSGIYKFTAGYPQNHGMELGLANPEWGYHADFFRRLAPGHWFFKFLNHSAWSVQLLGALLMLWGPTRFAGAVMIFGSFAFIATQIRLGLLCEIVMLGALLFCAAGTPGDDWISQLVPEWAVSPSSSSLLPDAVQGLLTFALTGYLVLLPLAHLGLFYNFYGRKSLPRPLQRALEAYTNFFGIIIWRVFSADLVNFFILIHRQPRGDKSQPELLTRYGWRGGWRFSHVGESITLTSVFTTLKYYPSNSEIFHDRLLRYARTFKCPADSVLVFEYVSIRKAAEQFEYVTTAEFCVDLAASAIREHVLNPAAPLRTAHAASPILEGARPGSYVPLKA